MYHVPVHSLAERLSGYIRREELLAAGDRVGVAVSGGIDSVALLRLLLELRSELGIAISVVHFNHQLRAAESDLDQEFVRKLAQEHGLEFHVDAGDVAQLAAEQQSGVEAAARELRYEFFQSLLGADDGSGLELDPSPARVLHKIATGHTLDDQAETVLMRLIRGTGPRGLGGIYPRILVEYEDGDGHGEIVRPLLRIRRRELEQYLADLQQPWREDSTNTDSKFTRNRLRKLVFPLLEREFNPAVVESFAELAEIARDEEDYWENESSGWLGTVVQWSSPSGVRGLPVEGDSALVQIRPSQASENDAEWLARPEEPGPVMRNASVSRPWLLTEPKAVQRRVLKAIGEQAGIPLEFRHIEEILRFAADDGASGKELSLPLGWKMVREPEAMVFVTPDRSRQERLPDYEYSLPVPGRAAVPELGGVIEALRLAPEAERAEYNPQQLLRADLLPRSLIVRNWRPGDRFWPAHTKAPKKIKELLQEQPVTRQVGQQERRLWPVAVSGEEIVWMRGCPVPARWCAKRGQEAVLIRELPWAVEDSRV
ncbi:MAG: tRNA lysidine(34) synthetase TilS [Candidatus Sulfotelmatobacter sp.]